MKKRIVMDINNPELVTRLNVVKAASGVRSWEQFLKKQLPVLENIQELTTKVLQKFSGKEKQAILATLNGLLLTPELLGYHLQASLEENNTLEFQIDVDVNKLLEKVKMMDRLECALIELWAVGWWALSTLGLDYNKK